MYRSFLCKIWECGVFWWYKRAICASFLYQFSPSKVSHYTVLVLILASYPGSPPTKSLGTRLPQSQPFILCCLLVSLLQVMEGWMEVCKRGYLNSRLKPIAD